MSNTDPNDYVLDLVIKGDISAPHFVDEVSFTINGVQTSGGYEFLQTLGPGARLTVDRLFRWRERKSDQLLSNTGQSQEVCATERCGERVELWRGAERWPWCTTTLTWSSTSTLKIRKQPSPLRAASTFARNSGTSMAPTPGSCRPMANTRPASTVAAVAPAAKRPSPSRQACCCWVLDSRSSHGACAASLASSGLRFGYGSQRKRAEPEFRPFLFFVERRLKGYFFPFPGAALVLKDHVGPDVNPAVFFATTSQEYAAPSCTEPTRNAWS